MDLLKLVLNSCESCAERQSCVKVDFVGDDLTTGFFVYI